MAVDAIRHGALDFIEKPFDAAAIVARVRDAIAGLGAPAGKRPRAGARVSRP